MTQTISVTIHCIPRPMYRKEVAGPPPLVTKQTDAEDAQTCNMVHETDTNVSALCCVLMQFMNMPSAQTIAFVHALLTSLPGPGTAAEAAAMISFDGKTNRTRLEKIDRLRELEEHGEYML